MGLHMFVSSRISSRLWSKLSEVALLPPRTPTLMRRRVATSCSPALLSSSVRLHSYRAAAIARSPTSFTVAIVVYASFAGEFLFRYAHDRPIRGTAPTSTRGSSFTLADGTASPRNGDLDKEVGSPNLPMRGVAPGERTMLGALVFSTLVIFIRSVYRLIELGDGWEGRIIHTQVYFGEWLLRRTPILAWIGGLYCDYRCARRRDDRPRDLHAQHLPPWASAVAVNACFRDRMLWADGPCRLIARR